MYKSLLAENRKALQFLHMAKGFDFEKPFVCIRGEGRFTYNQVKKEIQKHIDGEFSAGLLIKANENKCCNRELYYAVFGNTRLDGQRQGRDLAYWSYNVGYNWGVGDFEDMRKNATDHYYIVAQSAEHIREPEREKAVDWKGRFRLDEERTWNPSFTSNGKGKKWISAVDLVAIGGTGEKVTYKVDRYMTETERLEDVMDKSGYIVATRRAELKRAALQLRIKRAKEEAERADFSEMEKEIVALLESQKCKLSRAVLGIGNEEDAHKVEKMASAIRWAFWDMEWYRDRKENGKFSNVMEKKKALEKIRERFE